MRASKYLSALIVIIAFTALTACSVNSPGNNGAPPSQSEIPTPLTNEPSPVIFTSSETDNALAEYLAPLLDWESREDIVVTLIRDDIGLRIPAAPMDYEQLAECLLEMELSPLAEAQNVIDIPHPFTLQFKTGGKVEAISFTNEKITISGTDYSPAKPEALYAYLRDEHEKFLTGDIYLLQTEMPFTDFDIASVRLEEHENYSAGVTEVNTTDPTDISRIMQALNQTVARRFKPGEEPGMIMGVGGNNFICTFTFQDGSSWSINSRGLTTITSQSGAAEDVLTLYMDFEAVFGLLERNAAVPQLAASIGGVSPTIYEMGYRSEKTQKSRSDIIPVAMHFDSDEVLPQKESHICGLEWHNGLGVQSVPISVTATLYTETEDPANPVDAGTPLEVNSNEIILPGGEGKRYVTVRAEFADSTWTEHVFSYRSSTFPTAFYDIEYGNNEGSVLLTRHDSGVWVTGTQNRKYVDFVMGLELSPSDGTPQPLPIRKPFAMGFTVEDMIFEFTFDPEKGVTFAGEPYKVGNPQAIEELYATLDIYDPNIFEHINYNLRGFLTKDAAFFTKQFPFAASDVKLFNIIEEEPERRIIHDMSGLTSDEITDILDYVVIGSEWREDDYYNLRRFYLSYEVTLKDGTVYIIGERILKNGQDTGWYTIQSDSDIAAHVIEGHTGAEQKREKRINGSIGMDDAGNIIIE